MPLMSASKPADPWIQCPIPKPRASLRLFCFPYSGGSAATYRKWGDVLPDSIEVCPVQLPGREMRLMEPVFSSVFPLVDALTPAMVPFLDKPFALFGHSMGALVIFELARKLRRERKLLPECLFPSARVAPGFPLKDRPVSNLPEDELVQELIQFNGTEQGVLQDKELLSLILPTLRADFALHEEYKYSEEPPLQCPIVVFGGLQDRDTEEEGLDAWRAHTSNSFAKRMFAGDHFFINSQQSLFFDGFTQELQWAVRNIVARTTPARVTDKSREAAPDLVH